MPDNVPIINILTSGLPRTVTQPLYMDYNSRREEIKRIWAKQDNNYQMLQKYASTVEALLALSLFYRHIMGHIQGASSFCNRLNHMCGASQGCPVKIGDFVLDNHQRRRLYFASKEFNGFREKFQLAESFFSYSETLQFLRNCRDLLNMEEDNEEKSF